MTTPETALDPAPHDVPARVTVDEPAASAEVPAGRPARLRVSEDWAATIVGLVLLGLSLAGLVTRGMIP